MALHDYIVEEVALDTTAAAAVLAACGDHDSSADTALDATAAPDPASTPSTTPDTAGAAPVGSTAPATAASAPSAAAPGGEEIRFAGPNGELLGVLATASPATGAVLVITRTAVSPSTSARSPLVWRPTGTRRWRSTCCPPKAARRACQVRVTPPRRWATHPPSG